MSDLSFDSYNDLRSLHDFFSKWRDYRPSLPLISDPSTEQIRSNLGYLPIKLKTSIPYNDMLKEAAALREFYVYHRASGDHRGWRSICVHGISTVHTANHDRYGFINPELAPYDWTDISKFCPITTEFFRDTFGYDSYERIRFMLLEPGGYILPHADVQHKKLSPINIALSNPIGCEFVMEDWGTVPFEPGSINMLAVGNTHAVYNSSNEDRFHVIVHGVRGDAWYRNIIDSYQKLISINV